MTFLNCLLAWAKARTERLIARLKARKKWREMQFVHKARRNRKLARHERFSIEA